MPKGKLTLKRFNGIEEFEISEADIYAWKEDGTLSLNLEINADKAVSTLSDTEEFKASPSAEVTISMDSLNPSELVGKSFIVKYGMNEETEEWEARFYYFEHDALNNNVVKFLSKDGTMFHVKWCGTTQDVNYYDGSKPVTEITIEADFNFEKMDDWQD